MIEESQVLKHIKKNIENIELFQLNLLFMVMNT